MSGKWRPSLALVVAVTVAAVFWLPLIGILVARSLHADLGYRSAVLLVAAGIVLSAVAVGYVLWRILLRPIRALVLRAEGIERGDPGALDPVPHYGTREMQRLGEAMLGMGAVLRGREAVLRSYADHATHELKSPLTVLRGAAELLDADDLAPEDRRRLLARIDEAADRMTALLDAQRALSRAQEAGLGGVARVSALIAELQMEHSDITLSLTGDADLPLSPEGLRLVLDHLIGNAAAMGAREVRLSAGAGWLEVADDGPGVSAGNRDRIFDPFFTTRRMTGGTGMGLPIVRRMLEAHGATIALEDGGPGARFVLRF